MTSLTSFDCAGRAGYVGRNSSNFFPQPFLDYTSTAVPTTLRELWDWSEFMYLSSDMRQINRRLFNYFITDLKIKAIDSQIKPLASGEEDEWIRLMDEKLGWRLHSSEMFDNYGVYGNDFMSLLTPIRRMLVCPKCGSMMDLEEFAKMQGADFKAENGKYIGRCRSMFCKQNGSVATQAFEPYDVRSSDPATFKIKHWPVREMVLYHYEVTDETFYYWRPPEAVKKQVRRGDLHTMATVDQGIIQAVNQDKLFKFRDKRLFHAKESTISGIQCRGWGLPRSLYMARQHWTLQLARKNIQALGIDWVLPIRLLSPSAQAAGSVNGVAMSPLTMVDGKDFERSMRNIRNAHRRDPTQMHTTSTPVDYQLLGGEANQLFPEAIYATAKNDLIESGGLTPEIHSGSLTMQAAPVGLRLFEAANQAIPAILNAGLRFMCERVSEFGSREPVNALHERVMIVDNIETWMAQLQLATAGQISMQGPLKRMGIDMQDDIIQQNREEFMRQEQSEKLQQRLEAKQMAQEEVQAAAQGGGQALAGGGEEQAAGGAGGQPADPYAGQLLSTGMVPSRNLDELQQQAMSLAGLLASADNATRQQELSLARQQHPSFHALLVAELENVRQQAASQGQQMVLQGPPA